jgi:AcrR family transcriptional regulator
MAAALEGPALFDHPLAAALIEVVARRGYQEASIEEIIARAGVGREEFDRLFADKAEAVLRVFESYIENFKYRTGRAFASVPTWPSSLRAVAYEGVAWIEDHPHAYQFGMLRILDAGEMARLRREELFAWCAGLIDAGREVAPDPAAVPLAAPMIAVGAVVEIMARHAAGEMDARPRDVVPELMYGAVLPYLGEAAAREELALPPPGRPP